MAKEPAGGTWPSFPGAHTTTLIFAMTYNGKMFTRRRLPKGPPTRLNPIDLARTGWGVTHFFRSLTCFVDGIHSLVFFGESPVELGWRADLSGDSGTSTLR